MNFETKVAVDQFNTVPLDVRDAFGEMLETLEREGAQSAATYALTVAGIFAKRGRVLPDSEKRSDLVELLGRAVTFCNALKRDLRRIK